MAYVGAIRRLAVAQLCVIPLTVGVSAVMLPSSAGASGTCVSLGSAGNYSVYGDGSNFLDADTVGGGVAINGSQTVDDSTIATASGPSSSQVTLLLGAGGNSVSDPVNLDNGSAEYVSSPTGGTITTEQAGATVTEVASSPLSFSSADSSLSSASTLFDSLTSNTGTVSGSTTLVLTGTVANGTDDFNLTAATLKAAKTIQINVPSGSSVVINVTGAYSGSGQSVTLTGAMTSAANVMWNFEGGSVFLSSEESWQGSVLESNGSLTVDSSTVNGSLLDYGSEYLYSDTVNNDLFGGCINTSPGNSTPEVPFSILLPLSAMIIGFAAAAILRRRSAEANGT